MRISRSATVGVGSGLLAMALATVALAILVIRKTKTKFAEERTLPEHPVGHESRSVATGRGAGIHLPPAASHGRTMPAVASTIAPVPRLSGDAR